MGNLLLAKRRITFLVIAMMLILIFFTLRLFQIQVVQAGQYKARAASEMSSTRNIPAPRGLITDINGIALARSVSAINIVVDQSSISNPVMVADFVAPYLEMTPDDIEILITGVKKYSIVVKNAKPAMWNNLTNAIYRYNESLPSQDLDKRIVGFFQERNFIREYPGGSQTSSLIGFVREDGIGASGIESGLDSLVRGTPGQYSFARGAGAEIPGSQSVIVQAKAGSSVRLTIDRDIQWVAARAISESVKKSNSLSGTVIVMNPKTGAILAHATAPTFDPNNTKSVSQNLMRNPSVQDVYEPGSTGKIITLAAALEENKITPHTVFSVPYSLKRGGEVFKDHDKHPVQSLTSAGILAVSSNTGTIKIGELLSNKTLHSYLSKFGVGIKTGSGLSGESSGILHPVSQWSNTSAPTIAFGQGYSLTAMQATSIFATVANGGVRVSPTVIAGTTDESGRFTAAEKREEVRAVSPQTAKEMSAMMAGVVSAQGTAPTAAIPGYRVAGKTGTANRYDNACGCYNGYTASFIGFAPAESPEYVISVTIQDPKGLHYGGALAGPVFKKVMTFVLQSQHVPPTTEVLPPMALTSAELKALAPKRKKTAVETESASYKKP